MIIVDDKVISEEILEKNFVCDLTACKGACCIEGDRGAPLEQYEIDDIQRNIDVIKPYLPEANNSLIDAVGFYEVDEDGESVTTCLPDGTCAFAITDESGILKCGIEVSHREGDSDFLKPISCHLYPIRTKKYGEYEALNYHNWNICSAACDNGDRLKVPVFEFLKEPLERKYGAEWYNELVLVAEAYNAEH